MTLPLILFLLLEVLAMILWVAANVRVHGPRWETSWRWMAAGWVVHLIAIALAVAILVTT